MAKNDERKRDATIQKTFAGIVGPKPSPRKEASQRKRAVTADAKTERAVRKLVKHVKSTAKG